MTWQSSNQVKISTQALFTDKGRTPPLHVNGRPASWLRVTPSMNKRGKINKNSNIIAKHQTNLQK